MVGVETNGNIYYVNPFFLKLTGFIKAEILGQHYMKLIPQKERKALGELANTIKGPEELPYYQNNILTKSGNARTVSWSAVGIYDEAGNFERTISIGSDITDRHKAFEEINLLKSRLEEENIILKTELGKVPLAGKIIGKSDALRYVLQRSMQVAPTDSTVLLEGETGVEMDKISEDTEFLYVKFKHSGLKLGYLHNTYKTVFWRAGLQFGFTGGLNMTEDQTFLGLFDNLVFETKIITFEPQFGGGVNLLPWLRLHLDAGYRWMSVDKCIFKSTDTDSFTFKLGLAFGNFRYK